LYLSFECFKIAVVFSCSFYYAASCFDHDQSSGWTLYLILSPHISNVIYVFSLINFTYKW